MGVAFPFFHSNSAVLLSFRAVLGIFISSCFCHYYSKIKP
jgi:hypothetical protein